MTDTTPPQAPFSDPAGHWNQRFAADGYLFGTEPNGWLVEHADRWSAGQRVLAVADGEGRNGVYLAARGLQVDAFDLSPVGVDKARQLAAERGVAMQTRVASVDSFEWPRAHYDGVVAVFVQFADPAMRARLFQRMKDTLKPGGWLLLQGYTPRQLEYRTGGPGVASHLYTSELLREAFSDLEIVELREYEAELAEGRGHHGRSALIGLLARRP